MKIRQWQPSCSMRTDGRTDRQTDKHDEANSRSSQICERARRTNCNFSYCYYVFFFDFPVAFRPDYSSWLVSYGASWLHLDTTHSVEVPWNSDQPDARTHTIITLHPDTTHSVGVPWNSDQPDAQLTKNHITIRNNTVGRSPWNSDQPDTQNHNNHITPRHNTLGRNPLEQWSAQRTTHKIITLHPDTTTR